ncbi:hypothetical protein H8959_003956 [Pygathrix nigripes]
METPNTGLYPSLLHSDAPVLWASDLHSNRRAALRPAHLAPVLTAPLKNDCAVALGPHSTRARQQTGVSALIQCIRLVQGWRPSPTGARVGTQSPVPTGAVPCMPRICACPERRTGRASSSWAPRRLGCQ